ncbi:hypothetical protein [Clostridium lacusfryxellense]|uniref:hypothetical protein n=1 Tax=Clostridium lacusfryxellense TaxID=205328 RepID=UPI001C0B79E7|nr:hypothetical protein [Clostridium lacusfryxellense]MBU3112691.1 hypothetical protein [Clostridium lacusfryxellense]
MEDKSFSNWLSDNKQVVKEIINISPGFIVGYTEEIEGSINSEAYLDMMYWELGQNYEFEIMQGAAKYLYVKSRIEKVIKLYEKVKKIR